MYLRPPPRIKVLEALGAVADGRVECLDSRCRSARVVSSEGDRVYQVYVDVDAGVAYSDDNGTRFRGYIGYPIIALLFRQGVLPFDERIAGALRGIPWRQLNERYKKYAIVEQVVKKIAGERGVAPSEIDAYVAKVYGLLRGLKLKKLEKPPFNTRAETGDGSGGGEGAARRNSG